MLSSLQLRVAALFAGLSEASGFVLAGGAALIARGEIDRLTRDLDFFATDAAQVDQVVPIFEATVRNAGLTRRRGAGRRRVRPPRRHRWG